MDAMGRDVYRVEDPVAAAPTARRGLLFPYSPDHAFDDDGSEGTEFVEELYNEDEAQGSTAPPRPPPHGGRPPPISTHWDSSMSTMDPEEREPDTDAGSDVSEQHRPRRMEEPRSYAQDQASLRFLDPKNVPYPTQRLKFEGAGAASGADADAGGDPTPAFLRRAARDRLTSPSTLAGSRRDRTAAAAARPPGLAAYAVLDEVLAPAGGLADASLLGADADALDGTFVSVRDLDADDDVAPVDDGRSAAHGGGDYDGGKYRRRYSARDEGGAFGGSHPDETTTLLSGRHSPPLLWQGGCFGSEVEREDRRERLRKVRTERGALAGWIYAARSSWKRSGEGGGSPAERSPRPERERRRWFPFRSQPRSVGGELAAVADARFGGARVRPRKFSNLLSFCLCAHMALCGFNDLYLRYLAYRNPDDDDSVYGGNSGGGNDASAAYVSWNGEGKYVPPYWISFEGRVLNPLIGPGARTLAAFGALAPGMVLTKGQGWRLATAVAQSSSITELALCLLALWTAVGGSGGRGGFFGRNMRTDPSPPGLERRRGGLAVASIYAVCAVVGAAWSVAAEPGRLVSCAGAGTAGLLAAAAAEGWLCHPGEASKGDDEERAGGEGGAGSEGVSSHHNDLGTASNVVTASSNENFAFSPPIPPPRRRRARWVLPGPGNPSVLLSLELIAARFATHSSFAGTFAASFVGAAFAIFLFSGSPNDVTSYYHEDHDMSLTESSPLPLPRHPIYSGMGGWADDDSTDTLSVGTDGKRTFHTPMMRKSMLRDDDDDEPSSGLSFRKTLRKRRGDGSSILDASDPRDGFAAAAPPNGSGRHPPPAGSSPSSPQIVVIRVVGAVLVLLLTAIPASLIAAGDDPSRQMTRASVLGCKPMRVVYRDSDAEGSEGGGSDTSTSSFECAGGCIPLSRTRYARRTEGMRDGRCDSIGYRCFGQAGTMELRGYEVRVGVYGVPSSDGSCGGGEGGEGEYVSNDDARAYSYASGNSEVEGAQNGGGDEVAAGNDSGG